MKINRRLTWLVGISILLVLFSTSAFAKEIKIGVIFDYTGPYAAGGSEPGAVGTKIAIDMINERGGVEGYKINAIYTDAQSKVEVAINEAERLLNQEKVDLILGLYASGQCVPLAAKVDAQKKFMWANICVASDVLKRRNLEYVFRPQVHSDQYGLASPDFIAHYAKSRLGKEVKDVRVAIIHEDGPYGAGIALGNEVGAKAHGMNIVLKEGYAATAPDLSSLVTKLKRARPDVILHTGYNPDITLLLRQGRELGLKFKALIGHGAGYAQIDKLIATFGEDVNYTFNVDPVAAQLLNPKSLAPGLGDLAAEMVKRYIAIKGVKEVPPHASMGFNHTWIFLTDVLPRAITKYGGYDPESLRKAALDSDIPDGGTIQGYGVKFFPPGHELSGQNERSAPVVMQYVDGKTKIVWPVALQTIDPILPLPASHPYAAK
ncbi:MAG: ABC transporter ATP-binding protein [Desulfobacteraceae bacterium]|nr:MAG: ABC transporter ATP-binding protein [Desulfobacteraceae bacterium]